MIVELTKDQIEEIALCIVVCKLNAEEACDYAWGCALQHQDSIEEPEE